MSRLQEARPMKKFAPLSVILLITTLLAAADKKPDAEGFVTLFDGTSLEGWKKAGENPDSIQLKDGAIVANGPRCHLFYVGDEQPFKNFDFKCEVLTRPGSNGGIYFHT